MLLPDSDEVPGFRVTYHSHIHLIILSVTAVVTGHAHLVLLLCISLVFKKLDVITL